MTLDEHIHKAEDDAMMAVFDTEWGIGNYFIDRSEALEYAKECRQLAEWLKDYKRLKEQESSGDAVSRQAVHEAITRWAGSMSVLIALPTREVRPLLDSIHELPSVKLQEPNTGHWEMPVQDDGMSEPIYYQVRCSKCGFDLDPQTWHMELHQYDADKYCPKCGAKMSEIPTGSESEE